MLKAISDSRFPSMTLREVCVGSKGAIAVLAACFMLLHLSSFHARAQSDADIAALKQHGFELYYAGKYAEALPVAKQYAELIERRYGTAHSEYATALYYIAEVLRATRAVPVLVYAYPA